MLLLRVTQPELDTPECIVQKLPFIIGKSRSADFQVEAPGVWDKHLSIELDSSNAKFTVSALNDALLLLNGEPCKTSLLRSGDVLQLGACELRISLSPGVQYTLRLQEFAVWFLFILITAIQLAFIFLLR
jgi:hypothetical protein